MWVVNGNILRQNGRMIFIFKTKKLNGEKRNGVKHRVPHRQPEKRILQKKCIVAQPDIANLPGTRGGAKAEDDAAHQGVNHEAQKQNPKRRDEQVRRVSGLKFPKRLMKHLFGSAVTGRERSDEKGERRG